MSVQDVVEHVQAAILSSVTKVQSAPSYASDMLATVPTATTLADNLRFLLNSSAFKQIIFDLRIDILIQRGDLQSAMYWLSDVPTSVADIFRGDPTIGGHASTYEGDVTATFEALTINGADYVGYQIVVPNVKILG